MARTRKTRKSVSEPEPEVEEIEEIEEIEEVPVTKKSPVKKPFKEESSREFTAILQDATSLTILGKKFLKNVPTKVPMEHLKLIRDHGWFRVIV
jgi:hypothetical protein